MRLFTTRDSLYKKRAVWINVCRNKMMECRNETGSRSGTKRERAHMCFEISQRQSVRMRVKLVGATSFLREAQGFPGRRRNKNEYQDKTPSQDTHMTNSSLCDAVMDSGIGTHARGEEEACPPLKRETGSLNGNPKTTRRSETECSKASNVLQMSNPSSKT